MESIGKGKYASYPFQTIFYSASACASLPLKGAIYLLLYFEGNAVPLQALPLLIPIGYMDAKCSNSAVKYLQSYNILICYSKDSTLKSYIPSILTFVSLFILCRGHGLLANLVEVQYKGLKKFCPQIARSHIIELLLALVMLITQRLSLGLVL